MLVDRSKIEMDDTLGIHVRRERPGDEAPGLPRLTTEVLAGPTNRG
jgi:hypothetical protein